MTPAQQWEAVRPSVKFGTDLAIKSTPYEPSDFHREFLCLLAGPEIAPGSNSRGGSQNPAHLPGGSEKTAQRRNASRCKAVSEGSEASKRTRYVTVTLNRGLSTPSMPPESKGGAR